MVLSQTTGTVKISTAKWNVASAKVPVEKKSGYIMKIERKSKMFTTEKLFEVLDAEKEKDKTEHKDAMMRGVMSYLAAMCVEYATHKDNMTVEEAKLSVDYCANWMGANFVNLSNMIFAQMHGLKHEDYRPQVMKEQDSQQLVNRTIN